MTKKKTNKNTLFKFTVAYFLIVNTAYFWEGRIGAFSLIVLLLLFVVYFVLLFALAYQVDRSIRERYTDKKRLTLIAVVLTTLLLILWKPRGVIDFSKFESKNLLVAQREGAANCMVTIKLKENRKFIKRSVCFGVTETRGKYELKDNVVYFKNRKGQPIKDFYEYGIIHDHENLNGNYKGTLLLYRSEKDTSHAFLNITKNEFKELID